ncbi:OLC1v1016037C1 [Oldenlandia corymbosa var. corymbosa]|uniref:OLC1v1016037C1 n=1 Tax=Oldenlandia corymbosa var. corymbosa TaxID=529605 RepID=A0AAV1E778_OLDCO|nr:OLC1v1016037C1 [Oldenlandia corymbosa var. corymbosa]
MRPKSHHLDSHGAESSLPMRKAVKDKLVATLPCEISMTWNLRLRTFTSKEFFIRLSCWRQGSIPVLTRDYVGGCARSDSSESLVDQNLKSPANRTGGSVAEVFNWMVDSLSSGNMKGLKSGMLIAGWDGKRGPSLYGLDFEGKRHHGKLFACGECSELGAGVLCTKKFPYISADEGGKFARVAIRTAVARSI